MASEGQSTGQAARDRDWGAALAAGRLPAPVEERLRQARAGARPWVASMTPAELLAARGHGVRPIATVLGTCWMGYGYSWTEGHAQGWATALDRVRTEARAAGANAVVDVKLRTIEHRVGASMDFTLIGTAVWIEGLGASRDPVIATVPTLEFVRLLEMRIVPVGLAVGARYEWLDDWGSYTYGSSLGGRAQQVQWQTSGLAGSQPITILGDFWEGVRRDAIADLARHAATMGNGVLAHTQFGQLLRRERDKQPPNYLGRHIVVSTVVDTPFGAPVPHGIAPVVDMRDKASPFRQEQANGRNYPVDGENEGAI